MTSHEEPIPRKESWGRKLVPYLTKLAHGSAPFLSTFLFVHLSAPVLANLGGTSLASQTMILGREYYQTAFGERYLLLAPLAVHTLSGLTKRLVSPPNLRRRVTSILTWTGYSTMFFFFPIHFLTHRVYPADPASPIFSVGPSELDYEIVKVSLDNWPWRSWFLYAGLTLAVAWHAAEGMKIIWNTSLRQSLGAWKSSTEKCLALATLATVPVLSGLFFMSSEPIFAFSGVVDRFHHALSQSFFYRF